MGMPFSTQILDFPHFVGSLRNSAPVSVNFASQSVVNLLLGFF